MFAHSALRTWCASSPLALCDTWAVNEHYFSETPGGDFTPREIEVELAGATRRLVTAGGVFSPEHLDEGTRVLLRTLANEAAGAAEPGTSTAPDNSAEHADGPLLDLGCGWGAIALSAALTHPGTEVWAVDINARARELTATNAARLGLDTVHVAAPDEVPGGLRFAAIHSNPPIRVGKAALHELLRQWLPLLAPGGSASLVVAKHLGAESLQRWIATSFDTFDVSRAARDKGFHVIRVVAPAS